MFDIHQKIFDEGDWSDELAAAYRDDLFAAFEHSPEGTACGEFLGELCWVPLFLDLSFGYCGVTPPDMSPADLDEVLFDLFPRKVSTDADAAPAIIAELRAFWEFLEREYQLPNAPKFAQALNKAAENKLARKLSDSTNFGMAKSFAAMGKELGFDLSSEAGLQSFVAFYNQKLSSRVVPRPDFAEESDFASLVGPELVNSVTEPAPTPISPAERKWRDQQRHKKLRLAAQITIASGIVGNDSWRLPHSAQRQHFAVADREAGGRACRAARRAARCRGRERSWRAYRPGRTAWSWERPRWRRCCRKLARPECRRRQGRPNRRWDNDRAPPRR